MQNLTERDKRTIRLAAVGIIIYLVLFSGVKVWKAMEARRAEYQRLLTKSQSIKNELLPYENKVLLLEKLKANLKLEPQKISRATLVAEASAAIQKASRDGGVQLGPLRETPSRSAARELSSIQMEASGQAASVLTLLSKIETLGYPLVVDTVQLTSEANKPGMLKASFTVIILNYEQWKNSEGPNA